jgi:3-oxoacyl-[acyl-carrier-protein] synthase II
MADMNSRRVVVTGAGTISALGNDWASVSHALQHHRSAVQPMPQWAEISGLNCLVGAPLDFVTPTHFRRRQLRSMGRLAQMAVSATEAALTEAELLKHPVLTSGRAGVAYGSAIGSADATLEFVSIFREKSTADLSTTSYLRMMNHTAAVNIGLHFGLCGRLLTTSTACTAASQGIGFAYEAIQSGAQDVMLAGGAEELTEAHNAVFDILLATSRRTEQTPSPFDIQRDGLVLGEGASTLVLEEREHAIARGANILTEVVGFATNSDGAHLTAPKSETQAQCLSLALTSAQLDPQDIGYVCAHGTGTIQGDISESCATESVLGTTAISSLKGHFGHTLGACGGIEAWATIKMLQEQNFAPTLNLNEPDPNCATLDYILGTHRPIATDYAMSNNFAFGGINTSLIFCRHN